MLTGTRSVFPTSVDTLETKSNTVSPTNIITSEFSNKIGDCLFQIETYALATTGLVRTIGSPLFLYTISATGVVTSEAGIVSFEKMYNASDSSNPTKKAGAIGNVVLKKVPKANVWLSSVSAIGWIENGGVYTPVHVTPRTFVVRYNSSVLQYGVGFVVTGVAGISSSLAAGNFGTWAGVDGCHPTLDPVPSGNLTVRMTGIGPEVPTLYTEANA